MTRSVALLAVATTLAFAAVAMLLDTHAAVATGLLLFGFGCSALGVAHLAARHRQRLGSLSHQFALTLTIVGGPVLIVVGALTALMFVDDQDAVLIMATIVFGAVIATRAAQLLTGGMLADVKAVRDGLTAVGRGERDIKITTEARDEIAALAEAANAMVARLSDSELAQRQLIAGVSHDLRTPLTSLRLLAEAVDDDVVADEDRRRYLATMRTHIAALGALIDDLFELSRLQAGDIQWSVEQVRLDELVNETVAAMGVGASARQINVIADVPSDLGPARANPEKVQRVLFNLIQNAIRHTPADGSITVRAEPTDEGVEIEVADTGSGMSPRDRERAFDASFRGAPDAARGREGAGLGLAISRAIVEAHGGRIWLPESPLGTRVRFSLPSTAAPQIAA